MEQKYTPEELIRKYNDGTCNEKEKAIVESWHLYELSESSFEPDEERISVLNEKMRRSIIAHAQQSSPMHRIWPRIAAAAAILIVLSGSLYFYLRKSKAVDQYANDIAPGTAKPYLTLANGQKIILNNEQPGTIAKQGAVIIKQNASGKLVYISPNIVSKEPVFNTLTNPRGGKIISLALPDGTEVKLDAASSITYPTAFNGKTRNVATTGKVYFAVTYNKHQPFFTTTKEQTVEDLGTRFIVEAFDDEPVIKTTLIEGSVKINRDNKNNLLKPGQQCLIQSIHNIIKVEQADIDEETAWINGDFDFHNKDLGSIMRQLGRVYNIDVVYKDNVGGMPFDGMISRSRNISGVLSLMESTGKIHFEISGRRVTVIAGSK
jgi:transmembrane sensor